MNNTPTEILSREDALVTLETLDDSIVSKLTAFSQLTYAVQTRTFSKEILFPLGVDCGANVFPKIKEINEFFTLPSNKEKSSTYLYMLGWMYLEIMNIGAQELNDDQNQIIKTLQTKNCKPFLVVTFGESCCDMYLAPDVDDAHKMVASAYETTCSVIKLHEILFASMYKTYEAFEKEHGETMEAIAKFNKNVA